MKNFKLIAIAATLFAFLALASVVSAQSMSLTAFPNNSNIFALNGTGFIGNETVTITLYNGTTVVFNFTDCVANLRGSINATEIIPTSIAGGQYNITAYGLASNETLTIVNFTVPNLAGAPGTNGAQGVSVTGAPGATGIPGVKGDKGDRGDTNDVATFAVGFSFVCMIITMAVAISVARKKSKPLF